MNGIAFCLTSLLAVSAVGRGHGGAVPGRAAPGSGGPALVNRLGHNPASRHHVFRRAGFYPYALPVFDAGGDYGPPAGWNALIVPPLAPQVVAPPREVRLEIREYSFPQQSAAAPPPAARAEEETFSIALADGSRHAANAVWVQEGFLHYVDTEDEHRQVPLSSVDRQLTRRLNREKNLAVWLPAQ